MSGTIKLWDLPPRPKKPIKIYGLRDGKTNSDIIVLYHHIDGMYSYCTIEGRGEDSHVHLSAATPLLKFQDGYIVTGEEEYGSNHEVDEIATG